MKKYRVCKTIYYESVVEAANREDAVKVAEIEPDYMVGRSVRVEEIREETIAQQQPAA